jgi:hypothetical protein
MYSVLLSKQWHTTSLYSTHRFVFLLEEELRTNSPTGVPGHFGQIECRVQRIIWSKKNDKLKAIST